MAQQTIDIGAAPNDGTGDTLRDAGDKINDNFTELYAGLTGLLDFKGSTDCSANPNYPAASKGDYYLVSVAGKIGGASGVVVSAGDSYFAIADNAGGTQVSVGTSWAVVEGNLGFSPVNKAGDTMTGDLAVPDEAYDATAWNGSMEVPTKNAVRDKIESVVAGSGSVSDTVYGAGWDGDTTTAPSKNAVYDKIETIAGGSVTSWKQAVRAATVTAGTLASSFENGDTIDGVVLATNDRILIKDQAAPAENGVYVVAASGAPTRATDADSSTELVSAMVPVSEGTINADTLWNCTNNATITVNTTGLTFAQIPTSPSRLYSDVTDGGTPASNVETDLATYTLPANALGSDGMGVRITAWGTLTATTRTRTVTLYFGGLTMLTFSSSLAAAVQWRGEFVLLRSGSSAQTGSGRSGMGQSGANEDLVYRTRRVAGTEALGSSVIIKATGTVAGAAVANDIVCNGFLVEIIR